MPSFRAWILSLLWLSSGSPLLIGCAEEVPPEANPCAEVSCSDHGACRVEAGAAACSCDEGYDAVGLECLTSGGPCAGIDCSGHGTCTSVGQGTRCDCQPGYREEGLACVPAGDPCAGVTCSGRGRCTAADGSASCECDEGYHDEALECVLELLDCSEADVLCVDDTQGDSQEFSDIQGAADVVQPGQIIQIWDGRYAGFELSTSGLPESRVIIRAAGTGAIIDRDGPSGYGVWLRRTSHVTVEGLGIQGVSGRGVAHREATPEEPSRGLIIRGLRIEDAGREGMYLSEVADSLIEGNTISGSGTSGADRTHGIYLANAGSDGTTIRGNKIWGSGDAGIHFNGDLSIGDDGIISGLLVEGNTIFENGQNGLNMDGVQDSVIRNNLIYGNAMNGLRAYTIDGAEGPKGLVIVNNTIHVMEGGGWCVRITEDLGGNVAFNNILFNEGQNGSLALDHTAGFASANNAVTPRFTADRGDTLLDLQQWQALGYGGDTSASTPAELLVAAGSGDYQLRAGTLAIDSGLATFQAHSAPASDISGASRVGAPDLGAYELVP